MMLESAEGEHPKVTNGEINLKNSNLDHGTSTSRTDRRTDSLP